VTDPQRYGCAECQRTDLLITQTSKLRKHSANGKKITEANPACTGTDPEGPRPVYTDQADERFPIGAEHDPDTGVPADVMALDPRNITDYGALQPPCGFANDGRHVFAYGECVCGMPLPGYVAPPEDVKAVAVAGPAGAAGFLMGTRHDAPEGGADAMDAIMAEDPPDDGTDKLYRNGRYALPDPLTGAPRTWTRSTTMAETISDLYSLNLWRIRMMVIGLCRNPWLLDEIRELDQFDDETGKGKLDPKIHKDTLNTIGFKAQNLAGSKVPASWGTEMHNNIEALSRDQITVEDVPDKYRAEVSAWAAAMQQADLSAVPHLIERRVSVPLYGSAGTFDQIDRNHRTRSIRLGKRVVRINAGDHLVGDVKSGRDLDYGWGEIVIQMAQYAAGARLGKVAVWNPDADEDGGAWEWEDIGIDPKTIRTDVGVVMHVPIGSGKCTLHWVDLQEGWNAVQLCESVRDWRKIKGLNTPFSIAEVPTSEPKARPVVRAPSWDERFSAVTSKDQGRALYRQYLAAGGRDGSAEAKRLIGIMKEHLAQLTESTA
jgi:hypothetical protein